MAKQDSLAISAELALELVKPAPLPKAPTLYDLETDLLALLDTEALVTPEQQAEFRSELAAAVQGAIDKRDRCGAFIRHCQSQAKFAGEEIKRLREREALFCRAEERMREYIGWAIEQLGPDEKGRMAKLQGRSVTLSLRANPARVEVTNEEAVPDQYKRVTVTMGMLAWAALLKAAGVAFVEGSSVTVCVEKKPLKEAIESGKEVPGADLAIGGYSLVVK